MGLQLQPKEWVGAGDEVNELYGDTRGEAIRHAQARNDYFRKAFAAFRANDKKLAKQLSQKGRHEDTQMKEKHQQARQLIAQQRNSDVNNKSGRVRLLDLHGLHVNEALDLIFETIQTVSFEKRDGIVILFLITGTGHHTFDGRARVKPAVEEALDPEEIVWAETQPGMIAVRVETSGLS